MGIEHNLDVIRAADWIIDLGPEGGDAGGEVVVAGTVAEVMACAASHTGVALSQYAKALDARANDGIAPTQAELRSAVVREPKIASVVRNHAAIRVHNAREHNLKSIDVDIPRNRFTVVTGISGSGKSTLAFDILFAEGQRRYLESLNAYARQFVQPAARPDVDAIFGIPPTVAIEQRLSRGGRKSTVATLTETYHFLRLLYVKLGTQFCPDHDVPIEPQSEQSIAANLMRAYRGRRIALLAPLVVARKGYYTDLAKWASGKGFGELRVDGELVATKPWPRLERFREHTIELPVAEFMVSASAEASLREALHRALEHGKGWIHVLPMERTGGKRAATQRRSGREASTVQVFSTKRACAVCARSFPELDPLLRYRIETERLRRATDRR